MRAPLLIKNARVLAVLALVVSLAGATTAANASPASPPPDSSAFSAPVTVAGAPASPQDVVEFLGKLYLTAEDGNGDRRLFAFDGSSFALISDQIVDPVGLTVVGDALYFSGTATNGDSALYWSDGSAVDSTGIFSPDTGRTIAGFGDSLMVANPEDDSFRLYDFDGTGGLNDLGLFVSITGMVSSGANFYFSADPDGSGSRIFMYDGVLQQDLHPGDFSSGFVWDDSLYLALSEQNSSFYRLLSPPDNSLNPATTPLLEYVSDFTNAGDRMYFTALNNLDIGLFSFDGTSATLIPGSPSYPSGLTMFNGVLILTGSFVTVSVCDVTSLSCGSPGGTFAFDGSSFTTLVGVPETARDFTPFAGRLYFDDNGVWKYIEPAALADTGLGDGMLTSVSALGAVALALGLIGVTMARSRTSQNRRRHAHHGDRR
jgi:hypothetical protein